jgi:hypothetical protein
MTKHSQLERQRRAADSERIKQIQEAWYARIPAAEARAFEAEVEAARARGRVAPPPDMAPGTKPNPPRPGREPKPSKDEQRPRRSY